MLLFPLYKALSVELIPVKNNYTIFQLIYFSLPFCFIINYYFMDLIPFGEIKDYYANSDLNSTFIAV